METRFFCRLHPRDLNQAWHKLSDEKLISILLDISEHQGKEGDFYKRWAAARILGRRHCQRIAPAMRKWIREPNDGVSHYCYGYEHSASHNEWPEDYLFAPDCEPWQVQVVAAQTLGLLEVDEARGELLALFEKSVASYQQRLAARRKFRYVLTQDPEPDRLVADACNRAVLAIDRQRLVDLEEDLILFAAASYQDKIFREGRFLRLAQQAANISLETLIAYLDPLRRIPDLRFDLRTPRTNQTRIDLVDALAEIGAKDFHHLGHFTDLAEMCLGLLRSPTEPDSDAYYHKIKFYDGAEIWENTAITTQVADIINANL